MPNNVTVCFDGSTLNAASAEALCLLINHPFDLEGIKSWFFLALGVILWGFAVWHRRSRSSGNRDIPKRRKAMVLSASDRVLSNTFKRLGKLHSDALEKLRWDTYDLLARYEGIQVQLTCLQKLRDNLEYECRHGIEVYRNANRQARGEEEPPPDHWSKPWNAQWAVPQIDAGDFPGDDKVVQVLERAKEANTRRVKRLQEIVNRTRTNISDIYAQFVTIMEAHPGRDRRWVAHILEAMGTTTTTGQNGR